MLVTPISKIDIVITNRFNPDCFVILITRPSCYPITLLFLGRLRARFSSSLRRFFDRRPPSFRPSNRCAALWDRADGDDSYQPPAFAPMAFRFFPGGSTENFPSRKHARRSDRSPPPLPRFS